MQAVTFETAKCLAEAGFPQPTPENGQIWYTKYGAPGSVTDEENWTYRGEVFAPTATDILRELPGWNLGYGSESGWVCWFDYRKELMFAHDNPAEAAAQAWLSQNAKP